MTHEVKRDRGPVLVTVEYRIDPRDRERFLAAIDELGYERRRNGAYGWGVFEDSANEGRMVETFLVESWLEHLRQRERATRVDRALQEKIFAEKVSGVVTERKALVRAISALGQGDVLRVTRLDRLARSTSTSRVWGVFI